MENDAREFGLFIDGIRLERNMSREDLCDEIMSLSQYKRYLRGDTSIPNGKLVLIAERLRFSINDIHFMFRKKHNDEYNTIIKIYNKIKSNEYNDAYEIAKNYIKSIFVSEYNQLFFDFCLITIQYRLKMVSDIHVLDLYSKLISYPDCANNESFNMVEISSLIQICSISSKMGNVEPTNILYRILSSPEFAYSTGSDSTFLPSIYSSLTKILITQKEYDKAIDISSKGIQYCISHETSNAFPHLLLFNSISHYGSGNEEKCVKSAKKCFMLLFIEDMKDKFSIFKKIFENETTLKLSDIIDLEI